MLFRSGALIDMTLNGIEGPVPLRAKVVWTRPAGDRAYQAGLELLEPSESTRAALVALARAAAAASLAPS